MCKVGSGLSFDVMTQKQVIQHFLVEVGHKFERSRQYVLCYKHNPVVMYYRYYSDSMKITTYHDYFDKFEAAHNLAMLEPQYYWEVLKGSGWVLFAREDWKHFNGREFV